MNKPPIAEPHTEGRTFGTDWSIANVATLLRSNAARGVWRSSTTSGDYTAKINQHYIRTVSAQHLPTSVSLIFMQLDDGWWASLCFSAAGAFLPWDGKIAEEWLCALFGQDRPRVHATTEDGEASNRSVRNFMLSSSRS